MDVSNGTIHNTVRLLPGTKRLHLQLIGTYLFTGHTLFQGADKASRLSTVHVSMTCASPWLCVQMLDVVSLCAAKCPLSGVRFRSTESGTVSQRTVRSIARRRESMRWCT